MGFDTHIQLCNHRHILDTGYFSHCKKFSFSFHFYLSTLLNLLRWHWLIKLYRCQVYNSLIRHVYIVLCVHHPKSSLLPSHLSLLYPLLPPPPPSPLVITMLLPSSSPLRECIHSLIPRHLSCFQYFAIMNKAATNPCVDTHFHFFLGQYLGVGSLGHTVNIYLNLFLKTVELFS